MYSMGAWSLRVVEVWFFYALFPVCLVEAAVFTTTSTYLELERWVFCHKRASNSSGNSYSCALILPFYRSHVTDVFHWTIEIWTSKGIFVYPLKQQPQKDRHLQNTVVWSDNVRILWNFYADADGSNPAWFGSNLLHFETSLPWSTKPVTGYCSSQILVSIHRTKMINFMQAYYLSQRFDHVQLIVSYRVNFFTDRVYKLS